MKLVTFEHNKKENFGALVGQENIVDLGSVAGSVIELLGMGDEGVERARRAVEENEPALKLKDVTLKAPVPRPSKLLCLAGNYAEHIREGGGEVSEKEKTTPRVFMKPPSTTVIGSGQPIILPKNANKIDWECEIGAVIGKNARFVSADEALDYVAGYTIVNDVSERELKIEKDREPRDGDGWFDWLNGKWFDTFAPMGPCLVLKDEMQDPQSLRITLRVNGETKQDSNTSQMIFTVAELVEWASTLVTLEPGDVISTGTPSGVGSTTGTFLCAGDVVEAEIEGIGILRNPVEKG